MVESITNILKYLEKKGIHLESKKFSFQVNSHPSFPSLLSLASALHINNIPNYALEIDDSEIDELPDDFLAFLELKDNEQELAFIEKVSGSEGYRINGRYKLSEKDFLLKWNNIVILIDETQSVVRKKKNNKGNILLLGSLMLILLIYAYYQMSISSSIYLFLSLCGLIVSILSLRKIFGIESPVMNKVCSGNYTDCSFSEDHKNGGFVSNFGDYSLVYFLTNVVSLLFQHNETFTSIQKALVIVVVPVIGYSLYYQLFKIRKICPLCIGIILILLLQIFILWI